MSEPIFAQTANGLVPMTRRDLMRRMGTGLGTLGLAGILNQQGLLAPLNAIRVLTKKHATR